MAFTNDLMGMDGIGWFWWNNPRENFTASYQAEGVPDVSIDRKVTPYDRFGIPADEIDIQVDTYSFVRQTPQMRVRGLDEMVQTVILKALPLFNQPGISELLAEYIRMKAKYTNNPDLIVLLEKLQGVQGPPAGQESAPEERMPDETVRSYERISRPGMTDEGSMQAIQQRMGAGEMAMGGDQQQLGQMKAS